MAHLDVAELDFGDASGGGACGQPRPARRAGRRRRRCRRRASCASWSTMPASLQHLGEARGCARRGERSKPESGNGLNGIRLNLHGTVAATSATSSRACSVAVVDAVEHAVLEGDEVARRARRGSAGRRPAARRAGTCVLSGTSVVAQRVVGRVQRHRQRHRAVLAQPVDHRHHAGGRQRDAPARQAVAVVVEHHAAAPARRRRSSAAARPCPSSPRW